MFEGKKFYVTKVNKKYSLTQIKNFLEVKLYD